MLNIMLTGVGGQGTVLAAKMLAQAAQHKGWQVRTAETIGMAQRGGSVVSHVRMGDLGEAVPEPLLPLASADLVVSFEPAEAVRALPYLAPQGMLVTATSAIQPVTAALSERGYEPGEVLAYLQGTVPDFLAVDDQALCEKLGTRKVLNTVLLASAVKACSFEIGVNDLRQAVCDLVRPQFIDVNLAAIDAVDGLPS